MGNNGTLNVQEEGTRKAAYVFDPAGNRLVKETPNAVLHYTHDAANEMNTADETSFGYDKNGNMIRMLKPSENEPTRLLYDYANCLSQVELPDGRTAEYNHNGDGHRMYKVVPGEGATIYYWDPGVISGISQVLNEVDADDNPKADYFYGRGIVPLGIKVGGEYRYYLTDIQGSILALIDEDGVITDRYEYDEYGTRTRIFGSFPNPLGYTGQYHDEETGFIYLRNRYHDPSIGRFISRDPIRFAGGMNFYAYCGNDPVNFRDTEGTFYHPYTGPPFLRSESKGRWAGPSGHPVPHDPWAEFGPVFFAAPVAHSGALSMVEKVGTGELVGVIIMLIGVRTTPIITVIGGVVVLGSVIYDIIDYTCRLNRWNIRDRIYK